MLFIAQKRRGIVAAGFAATSILAAAFPLAVLVEPTFNDGNDLVGVGAEVTVNVMDAIAGK